MSRTEPWSSRSRSPNRQATERATQRGGPLVLGSRLATGGDGLREFREHLERLLAQLLVVVEAGPGGNQLADDHVLLSATQPGDLARTRGFGPSPRRFLEGCLRQPARRVV